MFTQVVGCPSKSLEWFKCKLEKQKRDDTDTLYAVTEAGFHVIIVIWFGQNPISAAADWTCDQYVSCMREVCRLLRRCACDCMIVSVIVCVRAAIRTMPRLASWSLGHGAGQGRMRRSGSEQRSWMRPSCSQMLRVGEVLCRGRITYPSAIAPRRRLKMAHTSPQRAQLPFWTYRFETRYWNSLQDINK